MTTKTKKSSQHVYDYAVIGSGLSGLCLANALNKSTSNILLLDGGDTFGGLNRSISTEIGPVNNGLRFLPATELAMKSISFLEMLLMTSLNPNPLVSPPVTFEAGGLKHFLGFGENPPAFYEELAYFAANTQLKLSLEPHEWTQILFNNYNGEFSPKSFVTKFHAENGKIVSASINGNKTIYAENFIYSAPMKALHALLPEEALSIRTRTKLAKAKYWTAVCLDLLHAKEVTTSQAVHILNGTTQDDFGPCVGQFMQPSTLQYSQWMTFVDSEESEDTEVIGAALKKVKRQIKRAYPEALENIKFERILVVPEYSGHGDLKLNSNQSLPSLQNFWISTGTLSSQKNILGTLLQAELVCSALGCHPMGATVTTASEEQQTVGPEL